MPSSCCIPPPLHAICPASLSLLTILTKPRCAPEHLTGAFDASGSVQLDIDDAFNWKSQDLDVLGSATIRSGEIGNLEAFQEIANYLRSNRLMAPLVDPDDLALRLKHVEFEQIESPIYISSGTVQLPHTDIRSSTMNITLEGEYRFDSSIDYTLGFALRDLRAASESAFGNITDDGLGHQFFVSMTGTIEDPAYCWDREAQKNHRKENFQRGKRPVEGTVPKITSMSDTTTSHLQTARTALDRCQDLLADESPEMGRTQRRAAQRQQAIAIAEYARELAVTTPPSKKRKSEWLQRPWNPAPRGRSGRVTIEEPAPCRQPRPRWPSASANNASKA